MVLFGETCNRRYFNGFLLGFFLALELLRILVTDLGIP